MWYNYRTLWPARSDRGSDLLSNNKRLCLKTPCVCTNCESCCVMQMGIVCSREEDRPHHNKEYNMLGEIVEGPCHKKPRSHMRNSVTLEDLTCTESAPTTPLRNNNDHNSTSWTCTRVEKLSPTSKPADVAERGHVFVVKGTRVLLPFKYRVLNFISSGSFGFVVHVACGRLSRAVKQIKTHGSVEVAAALREVAAMRLLQHPNVLSLADVFCEKLGGEVVMYLVSSRYDTTLHRIIRSDQPLSSKHRLYFAKQILSGLAHIHESGLMHRDLKPDNIFVMQDCSVVVADLGMCRAIHFSSVFANEIEPHSDYVCTRWYRAPEVHMSPGNYSEAIDLWSLGCIIAELLVRKPLFPAKSNKELVDTIASVLGDPTMEDLMSACTSHRKNMEWVQVSLHGRLDKVLTSDTTTEDERWLIKSFLRWSPTLRLKAASALQHKCFNQLGSNYDFSHDKQQARRLQEVPKVLHTRVDMLSKQETSVEFERLGIRTLAL